MVADVFQFLTLVTMLAYLLFIMNRLGMFRQKRDENEELKARINALEKQVKNLTQRLNALDSGSWEIEELLKPYDLVDDVSLEETSLDEKDVF